MSTLKRRAATRKSSPRPARTGTVVYHLDREDRFVSTNSAWDHFARGNGAPELAAQKVYGSPLWLFVASLETAMIYRKLFARVREDGVRVRIPFCCDSPDLRRFMRMEIRPWKAGGLEIACRLLRVKKRRRMPLLDAEQPHTRQMIRMCSWCLRVEEPATRWTVLETYARESRIMERERVPRISHGICPRCMRQIKKQAGLPV